MVPVVWANRHGPPDQQARSWWDMTMVGDLVDGAVWRPPGLPRFEHHSLASAPDGGGAVIVVPARHHTGDADWVSEIAARFDGVLLVLCGDEEGVFPWRDLSHPRMRLWVQTPWPEVHPPGEVFGFGDGWTPGTRERFAGSPLPARTLDWSFRGQVRDLRNRLRMTQMAGTQLKDFAGHAIATEGFAQGIDHDAYLDELAATRVALCPSGPFTPDTFRLFEALEAGCVPVVEDRSHTQEQPVGYWDRLWGGVPFPVVDRWKDAPKAVKATLETWPALANRTAGWWAARKRDLGFRLRDDLASVGVSRPPGGPSDLVTVLVPTSPIAAHPDTSVIETTVASIRAHADLADAEIMVMVDGVRGEQDHYRAGYAEYVSRLCWLAAHHWENVVPVLFHTHHHQAAMTRACLKMVDTPLVFFVEHDCPLEGEVDWPGLCRAVMSGRAHTVRLHHETRIHDEHLHLFCDRGVPQDVEGVPLTRTAQWSQRPHLSSTAWYRDMVSWLFGSQARTMIEDVAHGACQHAWRIDGNAGWDRWRLWMYRPEGSVKRSGHLDARGGDPKYPMRIVYDDGNVPPGAPQPSEAW